MSVICYSISARLCTMLRKCRRKSSVAGQTVVEYILLTSVVVAAALALNGPVTAGLGKFLSTYTQSAQTTGPEGGKTSRNNYYQSGGSPGDAKVDVK